MAIKHSKYRNTGILFELLVRQTTSDLLQNKDSKAVKLLKKYFTGTELGGEYQLYQSFVSSPKLNENKAEMLISTILEQHKKLDISKINRLKYNLIKEIKQTYDLEDFFKAKIDNYKPYASIYTIFESHTTKNSDTKQLFLNKINLLEHLTKESADGIKVNQQMVNDLLKEDKEIRLLAYKIIVEKFNNKYNNLSDKQKNVLKEYIGSISDTTNLKAYLNTTLNNIKQELTESVQRISDQVTRIKIQEVVKLIKPIKENQTIKDEVIASILQYYELIEEINQANI